MVLPLAAQILSGSGCSNDHCVESCEQDWEKNGEHCYLWSTDRKNWTSAENFCNKAGGHLATVQSAATFNFLVEGMNRTGLVAAWLGGNDIGLEGNWRWTDCSPWDSQKNAKFWAQGEPSQSGNRGHAEHCLQHVVKYPNINKPVRKWNDQSCRDEHGFLCSKSICSGRKYFMKHRKLQMLSSPQLIVR